MAGAPMTDAIVKVESEIRYWMVDPIDVDHVVKDLMVFGYPTRSYAEDEAEEEEQCARIYEVRITPLRLSN
jgi:hypothetical protein